MGPACTRIQCRDQQSMLQYRQGWVILHHPLDTISVRAQSRVATGLTPLNSQDLTTGTGGSSDRVGGVDLAQGGSDGESKSSGFNEEREHCIDLVVSEDLLMLIMAR
jgi:hypothetical protein